MSFNFVNCFSFAAIWILSEQHVTALNERCTTHDGMNGICIPVNDCPVIRALLLQQIIGHQDTTCGWRDATTPLVCCPPLGNATGNINKLRIPIDKKTDPQVTVTEDDRNVSSLPPNLRQKPKMDLTVKFASNLCQWVDEKGPIDIITSADEILEKNFAPTHSADVEISSDSPQNLPEDFVSQPYDFLACGISEDFSDLIDHRNVYCLNETADKYKEMGYIVTALKMEQDKLQQFQVSNSTHKKIVNEFRPYFAIGGLPARRLVTIYMALLGYTTKNVTRWLCDGVIINRNWILTAAHCLLERDPDVIRLGEYDLDNDTVTKHEFPMDFGVEGKSIFHPKYSHPSAHHDLALIRLDRDIPYFRQDMTPICLPWGNETKRNFIGEQLTLTGWGATIFQGRFSSIIQEVNVTVFDTSLCDKSYSNLADYSQKFPNGIRPENVLCAGDLEGGKDACQGDSGGPLVYLNGYQYTLAGIVSTGYGCGLKDYPGIYVPINRPEYLRWIKEVAF